MFYTVNCELSPAVLMTRPDGTPCSEIYGDVYHSVHGAQAQSRHVFLKGNGLPERWKEKIRFGILETGFGLGLNFLSTWLAWRNDPHACQTLHFVSLEKHPFSVRDLKLAHAAWPEFSDIASALHQRWPKLTPGEHRLEFDGGRIVLRLIFGDAVATLPGLGARVDAFFLDGFSPARNPDLWSPGLLRSLARLANPGATLATWSVAGCVRRSLREAGFVVHKRPGFAGKRQMLAGHHGVTA